MRLAIVAVAVIVAAILYHGAATVFVELAAVISAIL
jgi:hypothetical protein